MYHSPRKMKWEGEGLIKLTDVMEFLEENNESLVKLSFATGREIL